jgi:hypothetical protein
VVPWRLHRADAALIHEALNLVVRQQAGMRIVFVSNTRSLRVTCSTNAADAAPIDLAVDGQLFQSRHLLPGQRTTLTFDGLPSGDKRFELYLPMYSLTTIHAIEIDDGASVTAWHDTRPRWITYGSSITQCRRATSPMRAWPAIAASNLGWNHRNLGFSGQCKFDPVVTRTIASLPADVISVCLGINTHAGDFSPRVWAAMASGALLSIRDGHPEVPLVVISPILSPPRETTPGSTGLTLEAMRGWLQEIVSSFKARGDKKIAYVDGRRIIGIGDEHLMSDELHPDGQGIELMGTRVTEIFRRELPAIGGASLLSA